jgi:phosphoglycerol transferase
MLPARREQQPPDTSPFPRIAGPLAQAPPAVAAPGTAVWKSTAAYLGAAVVSVLLMACVLKLGHMRLREPLCYTWDSVLCQSWIKGVIERGWYLENPNLGAPFGQEMYDFPLADTLHFLALKMIGLAFPDPGAAYNLYYLLTFPLTTLAALYALRRFGLSFAVSIVASLLYTFLPLHFHRLIHYFLACYYVVPLMSLVIVQVSLGQLHAGRHPGRWLVALVTCVLTGMAGIYYAFFACFLLLVAAVASFVSSRRWAALGAGLVLLLTVCLSSGAALAPSIRYKLREGANGDAVRRGPHEAEVYGLRITQLLLPVTTHRLPWLARFKNRYNNTAPLVNENDFATLGAVGSAGFLLLVGWLLLRRRTPGGNGLLDGLAVCTTAAVLLATMGGFGSLFTYLTTPYIRGYNRIAVYLAFFALAAVAVVLNAVGQRWATTTRRRLIFWALLLLLLVAGVADQTTPLFVPAYAKWHRDYSEDEDFVRRVETAVPAGTMVYQLPYVPFPEEGVYRGMTDYDEFRPYLHSHRLRWSYGAMRDRPADVWHRDLLGLTLAERLPALALAGFGGVYVDRAGYADHGAAVEAELGQLLAVPPIISSGGRFAFFDMAGYNAGLRGQLGNAEWSRRHEAVLHPVTFSWLPMFHGLEESEADGLFRWCGPSGEVRVTNPSPEPRRVSVSLTFKTHVPGTWHVSINGNLWRETVPVTTAGRELTRSLVVPSGTFALHFTCDSPVVKVSGDRRTLVFRVFNFSCREEFEGPRGPATHR